VGEPALLATDGSLELEGGAFCGIIAVEGTLRLTRGFRFQGVALVGGDLLVEGGAEVEGLLRVAGTLALGNGSLVRGSGCAALRALAESPSLAVAIPLPRGFRVRPF
jgi:hypothetical protein